MATNAALRSGMRWRIKPPPCQAKLRGPISFGRSVTDPICFENWSILRSDSQPGTNASTCDGECNDCANVTAPKKTVTMSNFEQRVMSRFAHLVFSKLGGSDAYKRHSC